jgi:hypothetical protein
MVDDTPGTDNIEVVRAILEAVRLGDVEAFVSLCHPEY